MDTVSPFGSWPSPLSAADVSAASPRIEGARFVGDDIWWGESVAEEGGRISIRRLGRDGATGTVLPAPWNARSRVHEYGGGSWTADDDGRLFFVEKTDQRIWMLADGSSPVPLTDVDGDTRFGGLTWRAGRLLAVRERHDGRSSTRDIVMIALGRERADPAVIRVVGGSDFVAQPALSPDGTRLAWVAWNHPNMPWDATELRVGDVADDGTLTQWSAVTSGATSALQPTWIDASTLLYADDATGRWNLWRHEGLDATSASADGAAAVAPADADTGGPLWVLGTRWFAPLEDGRIVAVRTNGSDEVVVIDPSSGGSVRTLAGAPSAQTAIEDVSGSRVLLSGAYTDRPSGLSVVDVDHPEEARLLTGGRFDWGDEWVPQPRPFTVDGPHGAVHAIDYPPTHPSVTAPEGERAPYVVFVHGGPTAHVSAAASGKIAYFTSRGIGVLDVNYSGSSGYGRAYRERLRGTWGIADVDDVAAAATGLADAGRADPRRIAIEGGSAGGWTVLAALVGTDVFAAGISRYGVGDARALAEDTHEFEAHYLDGLIGPLPEAEQTYIDRSPLGRADRFRVPLLLLQGAEDAVVPPAQSEAIRDALAERGVPHAYVLYEGEGHGFRRSETTIHALESEVAFLGQVFGFDTPGVAPLALS